MILRKVHYLEFPNHPNYWEIKDVNLGPQNLIIGLNSSGKTRLINILSNLSKILSRKRKNTNGAWELHFREELNDSTYIYNIGIQNGLIVSEKLMRNNKLVLSREGEVGKIFSYSQDRLIDFSPPKDEPTVSVRRDKKDFPFLEDLFHWASNFHGYTFTNASPNQIMIPSSPEQLLETLGTVPYLLLEALKDKNIEQKIIKDLNDVGYGIKTIAVRSENMIGLPVGVNTIEAQEIDLLCPTGQQSMSQGMFRAFALLVIVEHILAKGMQCTIAVDDLGEGLDFDRSKRITELIFGKLKDSKIQFIATSNDRFLINAVDRKCLNFIERSGHLVVAYNYQNSKEAFDSFGMTGLNNFDLFSRQLYKK